MVSLDQLAEAGNFRPEQMRSWASQIARGTGYTKVAVRRRRRQGTRVVLRASVGLDRLLKQLRVGLDRRLAYEPHEAVHGFVRGRGIVTNAAEHLDRDVVLRMDLKDFFGTVSTSAVIGALTRAGLDADTASVVAGVVTVGGSLPQGFSTSPHLSNLVFDHQDHELSDLAQAHGVTYTRYADDLVFSGRADQINDEFHGLVDQVLTRAGWQVNAKKTRFMRRGRSQYVTGLHVGDAARPHVPRTMKRWIRQELYFVEKFGLRSAQQSSRRPMSRAKLQGWTDYIAHVEQRERTRVPFPPSDHGERSGPESDAWDDLLDGIDFPDDW